MDMEYIALSDCGRQVVWVRNLLEELGYSLTAIPISCDNQGTIFGATNPVTEHRFKHIDICFHYIREIVDNGKVQIYFVEGEENPADIFTKNLGTIKFVKFCSMLGLVFDA